MRPIDADALELRVEKFEQLTGMKLDIVHDFVGSAPTIDAVNVVQGEWKHLGGDEWLCSECGHVIWTEGSWEHPLERGKDYCEHCGAHMKGANNE